MGEAEAGPVGALEPGVRQDLVVHPDGDAERDGGVAVDERGQEVEGDMQPEVLVPKLTRLEEALSVKNSTFAK